MVTWPQFTVGRCLCVSIGNGCCLLAVQRSRRNFGATGSFGGHWTRLPFGNFPFIPFLLFFNHALCPYLSLVKELLLRGETTDRELRNVSRMTFPLPFGRHEGATF